MRARHLTRIEPTQEAEDAFVSTVDDIYSTGLWNRAKSWYIGANVPGKRVQSLNFTGGVPLYARICNESASDSYKGFVLSDQGTRGSSRMDTPRANL